MTVVRKEKVQTVEIRSIAINRIQGFVSAVLVNAVDGISVESVHIGWEIFLRNDGFACPKLALDLGLVFQGKTVVDGVANAVQNQA